MSAPSSPSDASTPRVDFYVIEDASSLARLKLACRIVEKAYCAEQSVLVWLSDREELRAFDELLWTFADRSFVPHEELAPGALAVEAPVLLSAGTPPAGDVDVIVNLAADVPPCYARARRVAEIIDGDEARRRAGRARFKTYRDLGLQPVSHTLRNGPSTA